MTSPLKFPSNQLSPKSRAHYIIFIKMYEQEEEEKLSIIIFITVELIGVERQVAYATFCNTTRLFSIGEFQDNEHYSHLESLLIQNNPKQEQARYQVHVKMPVEFTSEKKKILEKLGDYNTKIYEEKLGKGQVNLPMSYFLKKDIKQYNKELEKVRLRIVLEKLLQIINLERDESNKQQFDLKLISLKSTMMLDQATINALQIFSKQMEKKVLATTNVNTLYEIFNKCKTTFGTRCLKRWMKQPLQERQQIQSRLDKIQYMITNANIKNLIQNQLKKLPDLDRLYFIFYKVKSGKKVKCEVSDLIKIYRVVESLIELVKSLKDKDLSDPIIRQVYNEIKKNVDIISKISQMIEKGIDMSGQNDNEFYVRPQTQQTLQAIMNRKKQISKQIDREVMNVANTLKTEVEKCASNTHRYVLEANKKIAQQKVRQLPDYKLLTAKQTKITFITTTLTKCCQQLRLVEQQYRNQQQVLLKKMFQLVAGYYPVMEELSFILSELDVLTTLATIVVNSNGSWCRPINGKNISGRGMRHPLVKNCVPNNCNMSQYKTIILTGPNMGGKSTYIRTIGICTYLAHLGFYVPAMQFETPIIDSIITRVGASDLQVKGISTFMSEMVESSCMIETATENSLVLIDQLGRGTSTCEGFGIAWGICEYLHTQIRPFCLFATHFHEMTRMEDHIPGVKNMYTTCRITSDKLQLEYKVEEGKLQKSYGIEVMKMLIFPDHIIEDARNNLKFYEINEEDDKTYHHFTEDTKKKVIDLYVEMEDKMSHSDVQFHDEIREDYKRRIQRVAGVQN